MMLYWSKPDIFFWQLQSGCEAGHERERVTATSCAAEGCISVISGFLHVSKDRKTHNYSIKEQSL